jgi:hypothetical protein
MHHGSLAENVGMPKAPRDDLRTLQAQYPFAVVIDAPGQQVVLTPWRELRHFGEMISDETRMRQLLADAGRDAAVMSGLRRLSLDAAPLLAGINRLDDGKVLRAIAKAVAAGQIHALVASAGEPAGRRRAPAQGIGYAALVDRFKSAAGPYTGGSDTEFFEFLAEALPDLWCQQYRGMPGGRADIVQLSDEGYIFLFDLGAERVVAAFGVSRYNAADRDSSRMGEFLGKVKSKSALKKIAAQAPSQVVGQKQKQQAQLGWRDRFFKTYGQFYDRGHFMSHRQGGGLDINLFPQRADINQGHGRLGKRYRKMEKACVADQVFCFSRPVYDDDSWVPVSLEYAVCYHRNRWSVEVFPNK